MAEKVIKPSDLGRELVARLKADTELVRLAALEATVYGEMRAVALTNDAGAVDQGLFKLSWNHGELVDGAELRNDAPYAAVIEYGRRPGRPGPPLEPIQQWVRRKLVANGKVAEAEADEAAFLIRQAIHFRGTKPRFIMRRTYADMKRVFKAEALRRLQAKGGGT